MGNRKREIGRGKGDCSLGTLEEAGQSNVTVLLVSGELATNWIWEDTPCLHPVIQKETTQLVIMTVISEFHLLVGDLPDEYLSQNKVHHYIGIPKEDLS